MDRTSLVLSYDSHDPTEPFLPTSPNFGPSLDPLNDSLSDPAPDQVSRIDSKRKLLQQNVVFRNLLSEHLQRRHEALSVFATQTESSVRNSSREKGLNCPGEMLQQMHRIREDAARKIQRTVREHWLKRPWKCVQVKTASVELAVESRQEQFLKLSPEDRSVFLCLLKTLP